MGEGETDTPRRDQFSSRDEEQEFRAADVEGHPKSPIDALIDELLIEQKKPQLDMFRLADIRQRLDREHTLVMAQSVTSETAIQHMADRMETQELDDREAAIRDIEKLVESIPGLKQDIVNMADEAIGEMAEDYPDEMEEIITLAENEIEEAYESIAKTLELSDPDQTDAKLRDQAGLQQVDFESLRMVYAFLMKAQNELVDDHTSMLAVVDRWRKEHHQKS